MSEGKHTPGPWSLDQSSQISCVSAFDVNGEFIGIAYMTLPNHEANARLIAAAPDLLAALKQFEAFYPMGINLDLDDAFRAARAAIAKAEGGAA
jgi:hypothetical protein